MKLVDPQFQRQTKDRSNNAHVEGEYRAFKRFLQMQKARNEAQLV